MENKYTKEQLKELQQLPLDEKIDLTKMRINEWGEHYGEDHIYVSFSGGKDSTVLLTLARQVYPNIKAVFTDTGLEFPEVKHAVKQWDNVEIIRPEMSFKQVCDTYGFVYPSKDVARTVRYARKGSQWALDRLNGINPDGTPSWFRKTMYTKWKDKLLNAPFKISEQCCAVMKEKPLTAYQNKHGLHAIVGIMADESRRREESWLRTGCNSYKKGGMSKPMSFWTQQDVLQYIYENNIRIPSVYGEIKKDKKGKFFLTGEQRTGCMFCIIGAHLDKHPNKFERMKVTHPQIYNYCMNQLGLDYILDYLGVKH